MIVVDTSALMAIVLAEPEAMACRAALEATATLLISAATMTEALIVSGVRGRGEPMKRLLDGLGFEVIPLTALSAQRAAQAYRVWGKGVHPAGLNFGDRFAYALAKERLCPLLYVGAEFRATDIESALPAPA